MAGKQGKGIRRQAVTVGVLENRYRALKELSEETGQSMIWLVDRALDNFLKDEAPIWRRKAQKAANKRKRPPAMPKREI